MKTWKTWVVAAGLMVSAVNSAQAALVRLGDGTVQDTTSNLIWLQDWNVNGLASWDAQKAWAEGLEFAGSTDWRLPEVDEYVSLFASYGDLTNLAEFNNVQSAFYWSGTEFSSTFSLVFRTRDGLNGALGKINSLSAVAVRSGAVTSPVPEPQSLALVLLALGATVLARRKRLP